MGAPCEALRDRVVAIDVLDSDARTITVLPSTNAVLGIQVRGRVHAGDEPLAVAGVTGIQLHARHYRYAPDTRSILVRFTPQGASSLAPGRELAGRSVALADVLPPARVRELTERVADPAQTAAAAIAAVEELLVALPYAADPVVARAVELLAGGADSVAAIARTLGLGERQLERRFEARIGISPKRYALLQRFERAAARVHAPASVASLTEIALDAGYYDQSHFIRDARRFAGVAPHQLRALAADDASRDVGFVQSPRRAPGQARARRIR